MDILTQHGIGSLNNTNYLDNLFKEYIVSSDGPLSAGDLCEFINGNIRKTQLVGGIIAPLVLCIGSFSAGDVAQCCLKGIINGLSGLVPGATYYSDDTGNLTIVITSYKIGVALSATELLIKKGFWER